MKFDLVVINKFAGYEVGEKITDDKLVAELLASENAQNVVRVAKEAKE